MSEELKPCKNSLSGEHKWAEKWGKNKDAPTHCIYCSQLEADLICRSSRAKDTSHE